MCNTFLISNKSFIKKAPGASKYTGTTKATYNKKENPTTLKTPSPQTQNQWKTPTL
jgi:hypothetical protein